MKKIVSWFVAIILMFGTMTTSSFAKKDEPWTPYHDSVMLWALNVLKDPKKVQDLFPDFSREFLAQRMIQLLNLQNVVANFSQCNMMASVLRYNMAMNVPQYNNTAMNVPQPIVQEEPSTTDHQSISGTETELSDGMQSFNDMLDEDLFYSDFDI